MAQTKQNKPKKALVKPSRSDAFKRLVATPLFARYYTLAAAALLLGTTIFWGILGAGVHQGNADQIVNPYMFESRDTFAHSLFPGQHTYLLKWPIFFFIHLFGETTRSYQVFTVLTAVATVGLFALILRRIERRPLMYGTLILALASVLLLVPAQPSAGNLLPVNMAMVANRNLEYVLFIACLYALIRAGRLRSRWFLAGCAGLILLIASDKLFLSISVGGAFIGLICYALAQKWAQVTRMVRWFLGSIAAAIGTVILIAGVSALSITRFSTQSSGPYGLVSSLHQLALGSIYAVTGLLTNFGANPAFSTTYFRDMPREALKHIFGFSGPSFVINLIILAAIAVASARSLLYSLGRIRIKQFKEDSAYVLSLHLLWSTGAAFAAFIITKHYYAGDARYLTLAVFTGFIVLATHLRIRQWANHKLVIAGCVITGAMLLSAPALQATMRAEQKAGSNFAARNSLISQALANHEVNTLVGDYWRVMPIRQISGGTLDVTPLSGCLNVRDILSSTTWQPNLETNSFAYLLSTDKSQTDYPACTIEQVTAAYGRPNASVVIAGSLEDPTELLMFYDHGSHKSAPTNFVTSRTSTTAPIPIDELPNTICNGPTIMNVVAHQDDDLLFINPDTKDSIDRGECVRTVYVTAGDAGGNQFYWLSREQGSEAAYSHMVGTDAIWIQRIVKLADNQYITVANPKGNTKISLVFMRLPDGNLRGDGFAASRHESLQKLYRGETSSMHSVYGDSTFTSDGLMNALATLMRTYQPAEIRTQSDYKGQHYTDHSDHMAVSMFTERAHTVYQTTQYNNTVQIPIKHYLGYPSREHDQNVGGAQLDFKMSTFLNYARYDGSVCQSVEQCTHTPTYGSYLQREYGQ